MVLIVALFSLYAILLSLNTKWFFTRILFYYTHSPFILHLILEQLYLTFHIYSIFILILCSYLCLLWPSFPFPHLDPGGTDAGGLDYLLSFRTILFIFILLYFIYFFIYPKTHYLFYYYFSNSTLPTTIWFTVHRVFIFFIFIFLLPQVLYLSYFITSLYFSFDLLYYYKL